jgi:thiol peroxidase
MKEHKGAVTFQGNPLTLTGNMPRVGENAPDVTLIDNDFKPFRFSGLRGKVCVLLSLPSLDTSVCDMEARRFNREAEGLGADVHILVISKDLPFAQKRWCGAAGAHQVQTFSDYKEGEFGRGYGLYIKELGLLARSVIILDREGVVRYLQLVGDIGSEPDYDTAISEIKKLI